MDDKKDRNLGFGISHHITKEQAIRLLSADYDDGVCGESHIGRFRVSEDLQGRKMKLLTFTYFLTLLG